MSRARTGPASGDPDAVFGALAHPARRAILDLLRSGPRTTGEVAAVVPGSRFAAMQHLGVLADAGLVLSERRGRERWHRLHAVPLVRVLRRWVSRFGVARADVLLAFEDAARAERDRRSRGKVGGR